MSDKSKIQWTDATWNPVTGCSKISAGCANCYAHTYANRFHCGDFSVKLHPEKLDIPLRWKRPRKIFVNSMSDLFHDDVPFEFIDRVFAVMALSPHHTYQILTKRPERMRKYYEYSDDGESVQRDEYNMVEVPGYYYGFNYNWPLPNVWLGVTVENQEMADQRIPILLQTPAAKRFISIEPMLGPVELFHQTGELVNTSGDDYEPGWIDWVIVGGETGQRARPMHPDWARSIRDQCKAAGVPFMFKQWGEWAPTEKTEPGSPWCEKTGKKLSGDLLDGVQYKEFPDEVTR